jgi:hypothetical protein
VFQVLHNLKELVPWILVAENGHSQNSLYDIPQSFVIIRKKIIVRPVDLAAAG